MAMLGRERKVDLIVIQSFTPGPISSPRLPDMIRTMETLT